MRILVVSDLHGDLESAWAAVRAAGPDLLLCCGDWGDPGEFSLADVEAFTRELPVYTVYGNHDDLDLLEEWRNADGSPVLLAPDQVVDFRGLRLAGISGIWAKSHRKPFYVTDEDVAGWVTELSRQSPVNVLLSHGCPQGVADLTISGHHGGQRSFLDAFRTLQPQVYLTGHLHRPQQHVTHEGRVVRNIGATPSGDATLVNWEPGILARFTISVLDGV